MPPLPDTAIRDLQDLQRFEAEQPLDQRLPERSVLDVFIGSAARHPERPALTWLRSADDTTPRQVRYRDLLGLVRQAANLFVRLAGERPGVAYLLPSLVETHATLWGAEVAGYAVPVNPLLQPEAIAALLAAADVRLLVALAPTPGWDIWAKAERVQALLQQRGQALQLLQVGLHEDAPLGSAAPDLRAALAAEPADRLVFGLPGRDQQIAAYFHTGGTTGAPRLVAHTHRGQLVAAFGGAVLGQMRSTDRVAGTLPLFHVGGTIHGALAPFLAGMQIVMLGPLGLRDPAMVQGFWRLAARHRITRLGGVPTALAAALEVPLGDADLGALRYAYTGAAALPDAVGERFAAVTGHALHQIYGMTESSGLIAADPAGSPGGDGSVGWRLPYTELRVRRPGTDGQPGADCAVGEVGIVCVRGPHVSPGYRDARHDAGVFDDGLLITGDLGYTDAAGRLFIAGRSKDLIIRSGHNIDPAMIENALAEHPAVALAAAVGWPDDYAGELPVCYLTLRPGATVDADALHAHAQRRLAERPAWPREFFIVDALPVTPVGKIFKPALRCDAACRQVQRLLRTRWALTDADVQATPGGPRGLQVRVRLPASAAALQAELRQALSAYLYEADVGLDDGAAGSPPSL